MVKNKTIRFHLFMFGLVGGLIVVYLGLAFGAVFNNNVLEWCAIGIGVPMIIMGGIFSRKVKGV